MLRLVLTVVAGAVLAGSLVLVAVGRAPLGPSALWSAAILAGLLFERFAYKPIRADAPGAGWTATGERFVDPATGRPVRVFYRASDGERMYVASADPDHAPVRTSSTSVGKS